jgi:Tol biopolymer transport system component
MTPERWRRIEDLYGSALKLEPDRREGFLREACGTDQELLGSLRSLLARHLSVANLQDQSAWVGGEALAAADSIISAGAQLGPYKISGPIGAGGMGQVFRATDTRLGRSVAIKISQEKFSDRFEREARAIASLSHPNICTLHDVGPNYLVMELIEGETLRERLKRGKLSMGQTIQYGVQIADALAAAHAKGIVHRDLKPANVMLTKSGVKVLDFGLAKSEHDPNLTAADVVMGTPAYMAPEQFEGKGADARTDVYALGLLLWEMATGKRTPSGPADAVPPRLDRVVQRCLEKEPDERWQSARDLRWELESIAVEPVSVPPQSGNPVLLAALGVVTLVLLGALIFVYFRGRNPVQETLRMSVLLPEKSRALSIAVSPDGGEVAMALAKDGKQRIWVRPLSALEPTELAGTDDARFLFWSPDSRYIGFFADAKLKKIEHSGGPVQTLCDALGAMGGSWSPSGDILIGGLFHMQRIPAVGGALTDLPKNADGQGFPYVLPDGQHYLAVRGGNGSPNVGVWLNAVDGTNPRHILPDNSRAEVLEPLAGSRVGAVLFTRGGTLMALPFDMKRLEAAGEPFAVAQPIAVEGGADWLGGASKNGALAYVSGPRGAARYVWRDRQGKILGDAGVARSVVEISPDGKQLVGDGRLGLFRLEFAGGVDTQVTPAGMSPVWSPDGRYIAFYGKGGLYRKRSDGAGAEELLVGADGLVLPKSWSPDGRFILYAHVKPGAGSDFLAAPVDKQSKPLEIAAIPSQGVFSPDGHWIAYTSNESGVSEIYVVPFPPSPNGGKWLVSRGGGVQPRWRRDGKELFYISPDSQMMAVDVNAGPAFQSGNPRALFQTQIVDTGIRTGPISWDIAPDGRFLIITSSSIDASLTVALNWRAGTAK